MQFIPVVPNQSTYKVAILIKETAYRQQDIHKFYIEPLQAYNFKKEDLAIITVKYNQQNKAPVSLIREELERVSHITDKYSITYLLVCDAAYAKPLCKLRKVEPHYGYILPCVSPFKCKAAIALNYQQLFYNPDLKSRLNLAFQALGKDANGELGLFFRNILSQTKFPETNQQIREALRELVTYPKLTCDIETKGLEIYKYPLLSIAFGISEERAIAFLVNQETKSLLKQFFEYYSGTIIYHNATFDTKMLIRNLYEDDLEGLEVLHKNIEDTKIIAYLALNSTANISLSLKDLAFEFTGNYSVLDGMQNMESVPKDELLRYNATDALATWYVYNKYRQIVRETQESIYQELFLPTLKTLTYTELTGMPFNMETVKIVEQELNQIKEKHLNVILNNPIVKKVEKILRLEAALEANQILKTKKKTEEDFSSLTFNPNSHVQLQKLLYDYLGLPVLGLTNKGQPSTSSKILAALIAQLDAS